jgi:hypothetical protein
MEMLQSVCHEQQQQQKTICCNESLRDFNAIAKAQLKRAM